MLLVEAALIFRLGAALEGTRQGLADYPGHCVSQGATEAQGALEIYDSETSDGTIAKREFREAQERVFLHAFYSLAAAAPARRNWPLKRESIREEDLVLRTIEFLVLDDGNRLVRREVFGSRGDLVRTEDIEYDSVGKKRKSTAVWTGFRGDRRYETTFADNSQTTRLFDSSDRLIAMAGDVPPGEAPAGGWGEPKQGVAVSLTATPNPGRPVHVRLALTRLDVQRRKAGTYLAVFPYLELRDTKDQPIPPTGNYANRVREYRERPTATPTSCGAEAWLAGPSGIWEMDLEETYGDLPPGTYTAIAGACFDAAGPVSNLVTLVIEEPQGER